MENIQRNFNKFKRELAEPQPLPFYLRVWRMKCQRLAKEAKKIAETIFLDYKIGLKQLGNVLQHCDMKPASVPPLIVKQYCSFKVNMERSTRFVEHAIAAAAQATVMEHRLFSKLNIPLEFEF